jgi:hypothetical protein
MQQSGGTPIMSHSTSKVFDKETFLFRIWNGGMINQLMGIEFAVGACSYFGRNGILVESCKLSTEAKYINDQTKLSISNILKIPDSVRFADSTMSIDESFVSVPNPDKYFIGKDNVHFAEGRVPLLIEEDTKCYFHNNLCNYSIMFEDRNAVLDKSISLVTFSDEYQQFANRVSSSIGEFSGIHLRFTDFSHQIMSLNPNDIKESFGVLGSGTIMVATDDINCASIGALPKNAYGVESLIIKEFFNDFMSLSISNEITLGLVSLLVMCQSNKFIGTPKSTYSNYIHRRVNQRKLGHHDWANIGVKTREKTGKYEWNSYPDMKMDQKLWQREWPESLLAV